MDTENIYSACTWPPTRQQDCHSNSHVNLFYGTSNRGATSLGSGSNLILKERSFFCHGHIPYTLDLNLVVIDQSIATVFQAYVTTCFPAPVFQSSTILCLIAFQTSFRRGLDVENRFRK